MAKIVAMMPGGRRKTFPINQPTLTAGRSETCDIPLPTEGRASRQHMQVNIIAGVITVEDLNSANGTWFEGQKIARRTINDRDILTIGETRLQFLFDDNAKPDPPKAKKVRSLGTIDRDVVVEFSGGNFNEVEEPVPYVEVLDGEETRGLKVSIRVPLTVGRGSTCDLIIEGKKVSNTHTRFETLGDESWVSDLESTNGTFVNRRKLEPMQPVRIKHGDIIEVGEYRLSFKVPHEIRVEQAQAESTSVRSDLDRGYIARHTLRFVAGPRKGERVQMTERLTIGRHSYNNLNLLGEKVSNYHAEIVVAGQHFLLRDLKSTNGSYVGGRTVRPGKDRRLSHGDLISIGEHVMVFEEAGVDFDLDAAIARVRARANAKVGFAVMQGVAVVAFAIAVVFFLSEMVLRQINTSRRNTSVATPGVPMASPIEALSFEFDPNRIQSVPGWNCEIAGGQCEVLFDKPGEESELTDVKGGKWALRTRPNGAATRITLRTEGALSSELFARVKGQALDLSVQVRPDRFQGIAGIRVVWYGRDFSS
ncbi:MAG: FHA domain-containing protein [Planctomycetota bacterium]